MLRRKKRPEEPIEAARAKSPIETVDLNAGLSPEERQYFAKTNYWFSWLWFLCFMLVAAVLAAMGAIRHQTSTMKLNEARRIAVSLDSAARTLEGATASELLMSADMVSRVPAAVDDKRVMADIAKARASLAEAQLVRASELLAAPELLTPIDRGRIAVLAVEMLPQVPEADRPPALAGQIAVVRERLVGDVLRAGRAEASYQELRVAVELASIGAALGGDEAAAFQGARAMLEPRLRYAEAVLHGDTRDSGPQEDLGTPELRERFARDMEAVLSGSGVTARVWALERSEQEPGNRLRVEIDEHEDMVWDLFAGSPEGRSRLAGLGFSVIEMESPAGKREADVISGQSRTAAQLRGRLQSLIPGI